MIKILFAFLLSLYTANVFAGYGGNIGKHDDRIISSLADPAYRGVVRLLSNRGETFCTGTFISKNLVLTNSHCAIFCKNGCSAEFYNGSKYEKSNLRIVAYNENFEVLSGNDWALLFSDKESDFFVPIVSKTTNGPVISGGFGMLRIIRDDEIPSLKQIYVNTEKEFRNECKTKKNFYDCINEHVENKLKSMGKQPLFGDGENFKIQNCKVLGTHSKSRNMIRTNCDAAGGNSGGGLLRDNQLVGLINSIAMSVFYDNEKFSGATGLNTENFYDESKKYIKEYEQSLLVNNNNNFGENISTNQLNTDNNNSNSETNNLSDQNNSNSDGTSLTNQQPSKPNTDNNNYNIPVRIYDNPQKIEEILQQKLQDFDCD